MSMYFDPKTGKTTGKLTRMTPEEVAERNARAAADPGGVFGPPNETEYSKALKEQQAEHGVGWGLRQKWSELYGDK